MRPQLIALSLFLLSTQACAAKATEFVYRDTATTGPSAGKVFEYRVRVNANLEQKSVVLHVRLFNAGALEEDQVIAFSPGHCSFFDASTWTCQEDGKRGSPWTMDAGILRGGSAEFKPEPVRQ